MSFVTSHAGLNRRQVPMASATLAAGGLARPSRAEERRFDPRPGAWRTFEVTTVVEIKDASDATRVRLPFLSIDTDHQKSLESTWSGNATSARVVADSKYGAKMLYAEFGAATKAPALALTSRVQTRLVVPVKKALFGGWEGNWMAINNAHDVALPEARGPKLGFLMYPQAGNANGRCGALDPDNFTATITAREIAA